MTQNGEFKALTAAHATTNFSARADEVTNNNPMPSIPILVSTLISAPFLGQLQSTLVGEEILHIHL
jgi:hypothetical protein